MSEDERRLGSEVVPEPGTSVRPSGIGTVATGEGLEHEEGFSSRIAFLMTAVGCSVGFGNLWRFPYLMYTFGGAAFFIPYVCALVIIVIPVGILELGLGQLTQGSSFRSFASLGRRSRACGLVSWTACNIACYYPLLLCWSLIYMINSMHTKMPWTTSPAELALCEKMTSKDACHAYEFCSWSGSVCQGSILNRALAFFRSPSGCNANEPMYYDGIYNFSGWVLLAMVCSWTACGLFVVGGSKILGYIMYITMTLPTVFLIILVVVGATLKGANMGIRAYIAQFDAKTISSSPDAWVKAVGQGVFSVGCGQGTIAAFGAHNKRNENILQDLVVIAVADTIFAFLAGFSVFAVIGFLATQLELDTISELPLSGTGLAFLSYPVGLSQIPYPGNNILSVVFFLTLWLLGMDTLVGFCEAAVLMSMDSKLGKRMGVKRWHATLGFCLAICCTYSMLMCTNMGVNFLNALDHFSGNVVQVFGSGCQCVAAGWLFRYQWQADRLGKWPVLIHGCTWIGGMSLGTLLGYNVKSNGGTVGLVVALVLMFGGLAVSAFLTRKEDEMGNPRTFWQRFYDLTLANIETMRHGFNEVACKNSKFWQIPIVWSFLVKYIAPLITAFLFLSTVSTPSLMYGQPVGKPWPGYVFFIGQFGPFIVVISIFLFFVFPSWMNFLLPEDIDRFTFERCVREDPKMMMLRDRTIGDSVKGGSMQGVELVPSNVETAVREKMSEEDEDE